MHSREAIEQELATLDFLKTQIESAERRLEAIMKVSVDADLLKTLPCVGKIPSMVLCRLGAACALERWPYAYGPTLAASLGYFAPIALPACAIAIGSIAICFAEGGSRVPTSGGAYGYIEAAFGPMAGYLSGTALWVNNLLASSSIAAALADTVITVFPPRWAAPAPVRISTSR